MSTNQVTDLGHQFLWYLDEYLRLGVKSTLILSSGCLFRLVLVVVQRPANASGVPPCWEPVFHGEQDIQQEAQEEADAERTHVQNLLQLWSDKESPALLQLR